MKKHCYRLKILFVFATLLVASLPSQAFMPGWWYPVPGKAHPTITNDALDQIYAEYGYGPGLKPYTKSMENARKKLSESTAETDSMDSGLATNPDYHCDDERLSQCSSTVKSDTDDGVASIQRTDYDKARITIGHVIHALQDFYSHSNWIEMKGGIVNPEMGYGPISGTAPQGESTCTYSSLVESLGPAAACAAMDPNNIITSRLTSGYFAPYPIPSGVRKCFHGGSLDGYGKQGINKDASVCTVGVMIISPHAAWHNQAVTAATAAMVEYFNKIKDQVSERDFKNFLGFGPELGFAVDTTTSMTEEIDGVKKTISSFVNSLQGTDREPSDYVLGIIQDPTVP